ncbi:MFS transporter [Streptomyces morookaense]|uniref:MFS transporter n=1 Tax=Streptomyces morookaense TaxID=1970 RepID=A0A7Y7B1T2_STRMO|nr:MFS transporter [Streptomyces morookaense]NVK77305.1 MFS transporter [Streptomyces morookaense]
MLINKNFTLLWFGQALSLVGDYACGTAVLLWASTDLLRGKPYAPSVTAALTVAVSVVPILVAPVAGALVDRWDKQQTMLRSELFRAAVIGLVTLLAFLPSGYVPPLALLLCVGVAEALIYAAAPFFRLSRFVAISDVVPPEQHGRAFGYTQTAAALATIIGPMAAAPLVFTLGVRWMLAFDTLSFLVSYLAIRRVRYAAPDRDMENGGTAPRGRLPERREFLGAVRLLTGSSTLRVILTAAVLTAVGTGALNTLEVYFVPENLHASPGWYGTLEAVFGAGTIGGALLSGRLGDRAGHTRVFRGSLLLFGFLLIAYSRTTDIPAALVVSVLFGLALGALNTACSPLILQETPRDHLGRVMAVFDPISQLASLVSVALSGVIAGTVLDGFHGHWAGLDFGRIDVIFLAGGVSTVAAGLYSFAALRRRPAPVTAPAAPAETSTAP